MKSSNYSHKRNTFKTYFFENERTDNKFNFPELDFAPPQKVVKIKPFNIFKSIPDDYSWVHFFIDDYQFERVWQTPTQYINLLKQAAGVITTDFSMYADMPKAVQIYNCYRNRALARLFQKSGIKIIPTVGWSDEESFEWCFDGIAKGSAVAVSSNGCLQNSTSKQLFISGFNKMMEVLNPCQIILIGKIPKEITNNKITRFNSFGEELSQKQKEGKWEEEEVL